MKVCTVLKLILLYRVGLVFVDECCVGMLTYLLDANSAEHLQDAVEQSIAPPSTVPENKVTCPPSSPSEFDMPSNWWTCHFIFLYYVILQTSILSLLSQFSKKLTSPLWSHLTQVCIVHTRVCLTKCGY